MFKVYHTISSPFKIIEENRFRKSDGNYNYNLYLYYCFLSNRFYILNVFKIVIGSSIKINQPKITEGNIFKSCIKHCLLLQVKFVYFIIICFKIFCHLFPLAL